MAESFTPVTLTNNTGQALNADYFNRLENNIETIDDRIAALESVSAPTGIPNDGSVTDVKVASNAAISADKLADGSSLKVMTTAERTKLSGLQSGGIVSGYVPSGATVASVVHSLGTQDLVISVHEESSGIYPQVAAASTDANTVQFTFSTAPNANQYRYTIISRLAALTAPQVRDLPVVQAYAASLTLNAAAGNSRICTATGNLTLNDPANGQDGQTIYLKVVASGGQRVVTFAGTLKRPSSIASTLTIATGQRGHVGLSYEAAYGWTVGMAYAA